MSVSLSINAYTGKNSELFKKHYKAVEFCLENKLSFPKETSEYFKDKIEGMSLEDFNHKYILNKIKNGIEVPLTFDRTNEKNCIELKVSDIPAGTEIIIIKLD